jgi:hypothetical protein
MRSPRAIVVCSVGLLTLTAAAAWLGAIAHGATTQRGSGREGGDAGGDAQQVRMREGTPLDATGSFKITAERAIFTTEDGARFHGLENLNLERIAIAVSESPDQLIWNVNGTVTEFRGANYLLITRAMLKSKPSPPAKAAADGGRAPAATAPAKPAK